MTKDAKKKIAKMNKDLARINKEFDVWYKEKGDPTWEAQRKWLNAALEKAGYLSPYNSKEFWKTFNSLTSLENGIGWNEWQWKYIKILVSILVQWEERELHIST